MSTAASRPVSGSGPSNRVGRSPVAETWHRVVGAEWPYRLITFGIIGILWQYFALSANSMLVPTFTETVEALIGLVQTQALYDALLLSNQALVIGFVLSLVIGIPLGLLMGRFRGAERYTDVLINIMIVTPMAALIPLLMMSVGIGLEARVTIVFLFAVPMVIVNSRAGVRQVDPALIEMARNFGANEREVWTRILLPGALRAVMTGVRLALGRAVTGMVIVELLLVSVGIGRLILQYQSLFKPAELYATVVVVIIEALILISIARWVERRATAWASNKSAFDAG